MIDAEGAAHAHRQHHAAHGTKTEHDDRFVDRADPALQAVERRIGNAQHTRRQALIMRDLVRNAGHVDIFVVKRGEQLSHCRRQRRQLLETGSHLLAGKFAHEPLSMR